MRTLLLLLIALLTCTSCCRNYLDECCYPWKRKKGYSRCDDGLVFDHFMNQVQKTAVKFKHEHRLKLEDSNIWYDGSLEKIRLDFSTMSLLEFCEARDLLVDLTENLIANLESDRVLMRTLGVNTIDYRLIEIYIDFKSNFGKYLDYQYVGWISLENGCANYYAFNMRTDKLDWWQRRSESYLESRAITQASRWAEKEWDEAHKEEPDLIEEDRFRYEL